jgi:hypothetical protein
MLMGNILFDYVILEYNLTHIYLVELYVFAFSIFLLHVLAIKKSRCVAGISEKGVQLCWLKVCVYIIMTVWCLSKCDVLRLWQWWLWVLMLGMWHSTQIPVLWRNIVITSSLNMEAAANFCETSVYNYGNLRLRVLRGEHNWKSSAYSSRVYQLRFQRYTYVSNSWQCYKTSYNGIVHTINLWDGRKIIVKL